MPKYLSKSCYADTLICCSISRAIQKSERLLLMFPCTLMVEILMTNKKVIFYLSLLLFCLVFYVRKTKTDEEESFTNSLLKVYTVCITCKIHNPHSLLSILYINMFYLVILYLYILFFVIFIYDDVFTCTPFVPILYFLCCCNMRIFLVLDQ